jgi:hypothetical protein
MHEFLFADAARPLPWSCLRLPLRTYSIGHELLLIQQRNPLICLTQEEFNALPALEQIVALRRAVMVCSRDWSGNQKTERFVRLWVWWCDRTCNYPLEIANFRNYLAAAHQDFPPPNERADEVCANTKGYEPMRTMRGRTYGSPHLARLMLFVESRLDSLGIHSKLVYDAPMALANQLYVTHLEVDGSCRVENHEEREEHLNWQRILAETKAEEEAEIARQKANTPAGMASPPPNLNQTDEI